MMRFSTVLLSILSLLSASCRAQKNLFEVTTEEATLATLVKAIEAAGLVNVLSSSDLFTYVVLDDKHRGRFLLLGLKKNWMLSHPNVSFFFFCCIFFCLLYYSVFAPNDVAFDAVDQTLLTKLLTPEWQLHLSNLLTYHVTPGTLDSSGVLVAAGDTLTMVNKETVNVTNDNGVRVNNATFIKPDISASNGVVHIIDQVLLPSFWNKTIVDIATPNLTTWTELVIATDLGSYLTNTDGLTVRENTICDGMMIFDCHHLTSSFFLKHLFKVFAPSDAAFAALPEATLEFLKSANGKGALVSILQYHIVDLIPSIAIAEGSTNVVSLLGEDLAINKSADGAITVNDAAAVVSDSADILASNGIVHVIDAVLLPDTIDVIDAILSDTLVDVLFGTDSLSSLETAIVQAGIADVLSDAGPYT